MIEPILFPAADTLVIDYLGSVLTPTVHGKVPDPRPAEFVTVQNTGGARRNLVTDGAQLTVEAWAETDTDAHDLAQLARAYLNALVGESLDGVAIYRVDEVSRPVPLPDPSEQPRYSFTSVVALRGAVLAGS